MSSNPLNEISTLPFGAFPFDRILKSHFRPGLATAMADAKVKLDEIRRDTRPATFANTILALETAPEAVTAVSTIFFNLQGTNSDSELQELAREISPQLAAFSSDILLDDAIFARVKSVWDSRSTLGLVGEDLRLTEKMYKDFARNGALLDVAAKTRLRALDQELARLAPEFSDNVLKATNDFQLVLDSETDLEGIPKATIDSYREEAEAKGLKNRWLVTLQGPSYVPFMTYSVRAELREKLWRAYNSRAIKENPSIVMGIVSLRHERAKLLGYESHAAFVLEERMASNSAAVTRFIDDMLVKVLPAAKRDLEAVRALKQSETTDPQLEPWDYMYWSERLKLKLHDLDEELLRPYFKLENVVDGVFEHATRLYGLMFKPVTGLPTHHPDVRIYEVTDRRSGRHIGLFYADFFPRETKRSGAWMSTFREQGLYASGKVERPHVVIVCNFTKPTADAPSLLTLDEVKTLFHEFGHALHGLLSDCRYVSLGGTNVYWDFVELPSQIMENWVGEAESLSLFAKHYQTNQVIPHDLIEKIRKTAQFQSGYGALRQLTYARLDIAWHSTDPKTIVDVFDFEKRHTETTSLFPVTDGTNLSVAFSHIFAGGYAAGYYSYKWAEVLDADAFEFFKEKGLFSTEVASKFRDFILSKGGTEDPMQLYKKFRGREPDPDALLRREGLIG